MRIHELGSGDRAVVLLHGIAGSGMVWRSVAEELARDHRVLVPDLLGFGESPRPASIDGLWADAQAGALRDARVVIYEGAGHFLPDERSEQLAADLRQLAQDSSQ